MNLSTKDSLDYSDSKLNAENKSTKLNPNAAEFVPSSFRSPTVPSNNTSSAWNDATGISGKAKLDRSNSSISNVSDDEVHQYWCGKLPDDITPDFKFMGEEEFQGTCNISLTDLSIKDAADNSRISGYLGPSSTNGPSMSSLRSLPSNPWETQFILKEQNLSNGSSRGQFYNNDSSMGFLNDPHNENVVLEESEMNPVEFLASQFPGFAAESLAEVYFANGCDLNLTIEMLTQLELRGDNSYKQNFSSRTLSAPNLTAMDFPALPLMDTNNGLPKYVGDEPQHAPNNSYHSSGNENFLQFKSSTSGSTFKATDFASTARRMVTQDSGRWKYERNGSVDASIGTNRQSQLSGSQYGMHGRAANGDRLQSYGGSRTAPVWVETGEAMAANLYSELREEARDHARLRNTFFEQAKQAYLIGNKALAEELSVKGQLHNIQMKAAHVKARDSIYQQRNPVPAQLQSYSWGQYPIIDLHGLHVNEAIHILKQELSTLRSTARSTGRRLQVLICVGTGHHTKGSRTPARLPIAVERYLREEERLDFTETQPGLLRVVIY